MRKKQKNTTEILQINSTIVPHINIISQIIKNCCNKINSEYAAITVSDGSLWYDVKKGEICYTTGEEMDSRDVAIKYCPFCGKKIELVEEKNG